MRGTARPSVFAVRVRHGLSGPKHGHRAVGAAPDFAHDGRNQIGAGQRMRGVVHDDDLGRLRHVRQSAAHRLGTGRATDGADAVPRPFDSRWNHDDDRFRDVADGAHRPVDKADCAGTRELLRPAEPSAGSGREHDRGDVGVVVVVVHEAVILAP